MTRYAYILKWNPENTLATLIESTISRRPDTMGKSGTHHIAFIFDDTDITTQNKLDVLQAVKDAGPLVFFKMDGPIVLPDDEV